MTQSGSENRKRQKTISFRTTDAEYETIMATADRAGLKPAAFCRSQALDEPPPRAARTPTASQTEVARLIGQLGALQDKIDDLKLSDPEHILLDAIQRDLSDIRIAAFEAMGRKP